jgi:hypothetical protein
MVRIEEGFDRSRQRRRALEWQREGVYAVVGAACQSMPEMPGAWVAPRLWHERRTTGVPGGLDAVLVTRSVPSSPAWRALQLHWTVEAWCDEPDDHGTE